MLIYTHPPIEAGCPLYQATVDMCLADRTAVESLEGASLRPRQTAKQNNGINVLRVITLHDVNLLEQHSNTGRGWIACMFLVLWPLIPFLSALGFRQVRLTPCSWKSCGTMTSPMT
jgi:hypothetical protein